MSTLSLWIATCLYKIYGKETFHRAHRFQAYGILDWYVRAMLHKILGKEIRFVYGGLVVIKLPLT